MLDITNGMNQDELDVDFELDDMYSFENPDELLTEEFEAREIYSSVQKTLQDALPTNVTTELKYGDTIQVAANNNNVEVLLDIDCADPEATFFDVSEAVDDIFTSPSGISPEEMQDILKSGLIQSLAQSMQDVFNAYLQYVEITQAYDSMI